MSCMMQVAGLNQYPIMEPVLKKLVGGPLTSNKAYTSLFFIQNKDVLIILMTSTFLDRSSTEMHTTC